MKTVGEILKNAREKHHWTIDQIATATKIQAKFITALEANQFNLLPQSAFVKGFIRNYAQVVGKDPSMLLAVFRRDYGQDATGKIVPRGLLQPMNQPRLRWTPTATIISGLTIIITLFLAYIIIQFRSLSGVPPLEITTPIEGAETSVLVTVEGKTHPQATVTINHQAVAVNDAGQFSHTISLSTGEHTITIEASSRSKKTKTIQRTVQVK